jgi:two-component system, cell cycle response regulator
MAKKATTVVTTISKISDRPIHADAALVVIYGHDLGRKFDISQAELVIGRSSKADIQVDQESISRHHAKIVTKQNNNVSVVDMGSTNGTFVNDEKVVGEYRMRNGDLVKIGRTVFKFIAGGNLEAEYHNEIYRLTTIDGLTQINNRRFFEEALEREISRCKRYTRDLSLVMIDIDHFKKINDTFGHLAGDFVLKHLASTVKAKIRREDVFARYGGEEFGLLLPELDVKGAQLMAEKVRKLVEKEVFDYETQRIPITVSMGVATLGAQRDSGLLLKSADERLYAAKSAGRNRVCA